MPEPETLIATAGVFLVASTFAIILARALYPIPIRYERSFDETPETVEQRYRQADGQ